MPGGGAGQSDGVWSGPDGFTWQNMFETTLPGRSRSPCVANQLTTWLRNPRSARISHTVRQRRVAAETGTTALLRGSTSVKPGTP